jgi:hypothetical protein
MQTASTPPFNGAEKTRIADVCRELAVIDGRSEIVGEIAGAPNDVRRYIALEIGHLLNDKVFVEAMAGFLLPDPASQSRRPLLEERLKTLGKMAT